MGATPDTGITITGSGNAAHALAAVSLCLRGVDTTTPNGTAGTATGSSTNPNAPSRTTGRGKSWMAIFASSRVNDAAITAPTNYTTNILSANANDTNASTTSRSIRAIDTQGAAEDPAVWTGWGNGTWGAITLEIYEDAYAATGLVGNTNAVGYAATVSVTSAPLTYTATGLVGTANAVTAQVGPTIEIVRRVSGMTPGATNAVGYAATVSAGREYNATGLVGNVTAVGYASSA